MHNSTFFGVSTFFSVQFFQGFEISFTQLQCLQSPSLQLLRKVLHPTYTATCEVFIRCSIYKHVSYSRGGDNYSIDQLIKINQSKVDLLAIRSQKANSNYIDSCCCLGQKQGGLNSGPVFITRGLNSRTLLYRYMVERSMVFACNFDIQT